MPGLPILLLSLSLAATPSQGPIVVLPFKYVGNDRDLPRLQEALAETLIADIADSRWTTPVGWAAVRSAVNFRDLYNRRGPYSDSEAIALARKAGGRSVVVGAYETPGGELRLEARWLEVESGRELGRAQAAGPEGTILALREEIALELFGGAVHSLPRAPAPAKARGEPDPVRAFGAYGLALGDSDTTRVGLMRKALEDDPGFPYAVRELEALATRAAERARWVDRPANELSSALQAALAAPGLEGERRRDALRDFFQLLADFGHQRALVALAEAAIASTWPAADGGETRAVALYSMVKALRARHQDAAARAAAERFTREHAAHPYFHVMRREVEQIDREQVEREEKRHRLAEALARLETRRIRAEGERCRELFSHYQYLRAAQECAQFSNRYRDHANPQARDAAFDAWWTNARALFELGDFVGARREAEALRSFAPEFAETRRLDLTLGYWPRE